jgi:hypothetical protein
VSDTCLRLIPTDPSWLPEREVLHRALMSWQVSCRMPDAGEVEAKVYPEVKFIDQGANFETLSSPACGAELEFDWWTECMEHADATDFSDLVDDAVLRWGDDAQ